MPGGHSGARACQMIPEQCHKASLPYFSQPYILLRPMRWALKVFLALESSNTDRMKPRPSPLPCHMCFPSFWWLSWAADQGWSVLSCVTEGTDLLFPLPQLSKVCPGALISHKTWLQCLCPQSKSHIVGRDWDASCKPYRPTCLPKPVTNLPQGEHTCGWFSQTLEDTPRLSVTFSHQFWFSQWWHTRGQSCWKAGAKGCRKAVGMKQEVHPQVVSSFREKTVRGVHSLKGTWRMNAFKISDLSFSWAFWKACPSQMKCSLRTAECQDTALRTVLIRGRWSGREGTKTGAQDQWKGLGLFY